MSFDNEQNFTLVKKGYDPEEVYAYINELNARNAVLHSRNTELEQKLDTARRLIRRFTDMENGLRQNIADSKRAAVSMLADTKERSETLLDKTRESCGDIISDLDMQISERMNSVDHMKAAVSQFKEQLFELYSSHIELIDSIASHTENFEYQPDYSAVADAVEEFEAHSDAELQMPEFEEYPEESIFEELNDEPEAAEEPESADISISEETAEEVAEETFEEITEEVAEENAYEEAPALNLAQEYEDEELEENGNASDETEPEISEGFENFEENFEDTEYTDTDINEADMSDAEYDGSASDEYAYEAEAPEAAQTDSAVDEDDEYVRFLNNFISGDEEQ